jgi:uncharacterized protein YraI
MFAVTSLAAQQSETMRVNADRVNVRSAPSIDSTIVRAISKGTVVTVLSRDGAWSKVQVQGQSTIGWVRSNLLVAVSGGAVSAQGTAPTTTGSLSDTPKPQSNSTPPPPAPAQRSVASPPAPAPQREAHSAGFKEPGTATLISVLITGGGQFYAGDTSRGLIMFAVGDGALIVGCGLAASNGSYALCGVGALVYVGTWIYSIADAAPTTRRMNEQRGARVSMIPIIIPTKQPRLGLSVSVRF